MSKLKLHEKFSRNKGSEEKPSYTPGEITKKGTLIIITVHTILYVLADLCILSLFIELSLNVKRSYIPSFMVFHVLFLCVK